MYLQSDEQGWNIFVLAMLEEAAYDGLLAVYEAYISGEINGVRLSPEELVWWGGQTLSFPGVPENQ